MITLASDNYVSKYRANQRKRIKERNTLFAVAMITSLIVFLMSIHIALADVDIRFTYKNYDYQASVDTIKSDQSSTTTLTYTVTGINDKKPLLAMPIKPNEGINFVTKKNYSAFTTGAKAIGNLAALIYADGIQQYKYHLLNTGYILDSGKSYQYFNIKD